MHYVSIPQEIAYSKIKEKNNCLAPSKYKDFWPNQSVNYVPLSQLIHSSSNRVKLHKRSKYKYYEIGDINVHTGLVDGNEHYGYFIPGSTPIHVLKDDILVSTVRTYRRGIGIVTDENTPDLICSPAIYVIRSVENYISKEYLLAVLRSDIFIEQMQSFQNRGMYPRFDTDAVKHILIPIPKISKIMEYVSALQRSLINKEMEIRKKHCQIHNIINRELNQNQLPNKFHYEYPCLSNIKSNSRIDAGFHGKEHKRLTFPILNYSNGYETLDKQGLSLLPGPSLEIKLLGTRIDSDVPLPGFYRLITPKQIQNYGTITHYEYIGTPRYIAPIQYGDILFGESGTGRTMVYLEKDAYTINNAHAHVLRPKEGECSIEKAITIRSLLQYYKEIGITDHLTVGGSGGHLSPSYFDRVYIPEFSEPVQNKIATLYHNSTVALDTQELNSESFLHLDAEFDNIAGITELARASRKIKQHINTVLDQIVNNKEVAIDFAFLNR